MPDKKPLVIIAGPTAVGKTAISIELAKRIGGEIISADSMQVYRHMDIGSAKITPEEMQGVRHHLIDVLEPDEDFSVVRFKQMANDALEEIYAAGHIPIVVGGTGFYIQALLYDIDFTEQEDDAEYRAMLESLAAKKGAAHIHDMLREVDPEAAGQIHENNVKRVIRALEFYHLSGKKISEHNAAEHEKESPYNFAYFVLNEDRARLYERIDQRVDEMMEDGLLDEVARLRDMGCRKDMTSMQGLGYKEILAYLDGEITLDEAVRVIKRDTRHFAKRQLTWSRRERDVVWMDRGGADSDKGILSDMLHILQEREIIP